jgi:uncharacterized protein YcbK (DUF882 family)
MFDYFKIEEFACSCCGKNEIDPQFVKKLDDARRLAKIPFIITSGYRCEKHNKEVGGSPNSSHLKGIAVDISCQTSTSRYLIVNALIRAGFNRIGIAKDFIHCDIDKDKPQEVIWVY